MEREIVAGHFGERYVYGENPELDTKLERRWALLVGRAPAYVPITPHIPDEYLEQIEHDNAVYENVMEQIERERDAVSWRQEKVRRKRR